MEGLLDIQKKQSLIGEVRGKGLMIGVELVKNLVTKVPAKNETKQVVEELQNAGVIVGLGGIYKNVLRIQPPLVISEEQAKSVLEKIDDALSKI